MENQNGKNMVIVVCVVIISVLATLLTLSLTGVLDIKNPNENNTIDKNEDISDNLNEINYKEYKKFDEITLNNGSKWVVIEDSDKNRDYVTLLSKEIFAFLEEDNGMYGNYFVKVSQSELKKFNEELYDTYATYDNSILKKILEDRVASNMPVKLKEVNGYKIRLITVEELLNLDNNWSYDEKNDIYNYTGNNIAEYLLQTLTMSRPKIELISRRSSLYSLYTTRNYETGVSETMIAPFAPNASYNLIKPVINVYKTELN